MISAIYADAVAASRTLSAATITIAHVAGPGSIAVTPDVTSGPVSNFARLLSPRLLDATNWFAYFPDPPTDAVVVTASGYDSTSTWRLTVDWSACSEQPLVQAIALPGLFGQFQGASTSITMRVVYASGGDAQGTVGPMGAGREGLLRNAWWIDLGNPSLERADRIEIDFRVPGSVAIPRVMAGLHLCWGVYGLEQQGDGESLDVVDRSAQGLKRGLLRRRRWRCEDVPATTIAAASSLRLGAWQSGLGQSLDEFSRRVGLTNDVLWIPDDRLQWDVHAVYGFLSTLGPLRHTGGDRYAQEYEITEAR